jgi:hypothetical protein
MGSGAVIHVPSFIKIGSGAQKLIWGGGYTNTRGQQLDLISLLYFFKIREVGQKYGSYTKLLFYYVALNLRKRR